MHRAALTGDGNKAEDLLDQGWDANAQNHLGQTPMHLAAKPIDSPWIICATLIDHGGDPNFRDYEGCTPFHYVRDWIRARTLVIGGADPNATDNRGWNIFHHLADDSSYVIQATGSPWMFWHVLESLKVDINARDRDGNTPLHIAALRGRDLAFVQLQQAGANPSIKNLKGQSAEELRTGNPGADPCPDVSYKANRIITGFTPGYIKESKELLSLIIAVKEKVPSCARAILKTHPDLIDYRFETGYSMLWLAVVLSDSSTVRALLDAGAPSSEMDSAGNTLLHLAAAFKKTDIAALFLSPELGLKVNALNKHGDMPLDCAMRWWGISFREPRIMIAIQMFRDRDDYGQNTNWGPPTEIMTLLVERGADPSHVGSQGESPLQIAVRSESMEAIEFLLEHDGDPTVKNSQGMNCLQIATLNHNLLAVLAFLDRGMFIEETDTAGRTPLILTVSTFRYEEDSENPFDTMVVRALLDRGAKFNARDHRGRTALHHALKNYYTEIVPFLLQRGADPRAADLAGRTSLHEVPPSWDFEWPRIGATAESLIAHGALIEARDSAGWTPLHVQAAAKFYYKDDFYGAAKVCLEKGASVDAEDHQGRTPLELAAANCNFPMTVILLENGADPNHRDKRGWTALHHLLNLARIKPTVPNDNDLEDNQWLRDRQDSTLVNILDLLLTKGSDSQAKTLDGRTPLDLAKERGWTTAIEKLKD